MSDFFASPGTLFAGAITGLIFGFLLQRGSVTRYQTILGQFLWKDFTVLKVMLTAVAVGAIGIYGMIAMGFEIALHVKTATILGNAIGGLLFGVGMAILGYCPGTGVAALGDGSRHAAFGVLGMLFGAGLYAEVYPTMKDTILGVGDYGKVTIPGTIGIDPLWLVAGTLVLVGAIVFAIERSERRSHTPRTA